jgi:chemotaxis-related protein WspD
VYSSAALQLFDREPPPGYVTQWTEHYAAPIQARESEAQSVVVFRIGGEWLALPTRVFEEVAEARVIHSLPHRRSDIVVGLASIRGELLVCFSLADLLGLEKTTEPDKGRGRATSVRRLLVIGLDGSRAVFPADEVQGTHRAKTSELMEVPATVAKARATYTRSVLPWRDRTIGLLDEQLLFHTCNRSFA